MLFANHLLVVVLRLAIAIVWPTRHGHTALAYPTAPSTNFNTVGSSSSGSGGIGIGSGGGGANSSGDSASASAATNRRTSLAAAVDAAEYAHTFGELLSALTAEFVFNVAGDHVLFPMMDDEQRDRRLHTTATIVAQLLRKLHITETVYGLLNATAHQVTARMRSTNQRQDPVASVLDLTIERIITDPTTRLEYDAVKRRLDNQIFVLPREHGKFASNRAQTLYDLENVQLQRAEALVKDPRVKKLIMTVTFFKASQYERKSASAWLHRHNTFARAIFELAKKRPSLRTHLQRLFDETLAENLENYDPVVGDDAFLFQALVDKFERNRSLYAELKEIENDSSSTSQYSQLNS